MMIYKAYKYTYYKIYSWNLKLHGKSDIPEYNALFGIAFLVLVNLANLVVLFEGVLNVDLLQYFNLNIGAQILVLIMYLLVHYFLLFYKGRYKKIIEEFESESKKKQKVGAIYVWSYIIGSLVLLITTMYLVY
ncbi:hypothetical protein QQ008_16950 [Fulvivirgaceae bacterium BMA10]|uniref:Uncharacterized protein n=1 Tax=Splendidivirga corallicola TaxID=3051826 RepID=A0ABT8KQP9_9BACT|nr:hypothetical protein [Fulvivirgaceae bacterium BMA10]